MTKYKTIFLKKILQTKNELKCARLENIPRFKKDRTGFRTLEVKASPAEDINAGLGLSEMLLGWL